MEEGWGGGYERGMGVGMGMWMWMWMGDENLHNRRIGTGQMMNGGEDVGSRK